MASAKHIVAFSHESQLYGAPRSLLLALEALAANHRVTLITASQGELVPAAERAGIDVRVVDRSAVTGRGMAERARLLKRYVMLLRDLRPDVVYVNTVAHAAPVVAARIAGIPSVLHVREHPGYFRPQTLLGRRRLRALLDSPKRILCVSRSVEQSVLQAGGLPERTQVLYNGVDTDYFKPAPAARREARAELRVGDKVRVVGFVGQIQPRKGWKLLVEAFEQIAKTHPSLHLLIVGADRGPDRDALATWAAQSALADRVHLVPFTDDVRPYLGAMDLFVCPSEAEPFARVNLEAMSMGLPVLATAVGGNPEAVLEGQTGFLVRYGDPQALAAAMADFARADDRWVPLGEAGRARAIEALHVSRYQRQVEECLFHVAEEA